jgi:hypothetical protein
MGTSFQLQYDPYWDSGEDHVRNTIVSYLETGGLEVEAVASRSAKGRDIIVRGTSQRVIEVKGSPSKLRSRGGKKGTRKPQSLMDLQARLWVWEGIMQLVEHKCQQPDDELALGLPDTDFYRDYLNRIAWFRQQLSVFVYFVSGTDVRMFGPTDHVA